MVVADDVVDVDLVGRVLQLQVVVYRDELQGLRIPSQSVREQLGRTRHHFTEDSLVAPAGNNRQPFGHGRPESDTVVEVVVRLDDLSHALAGNECIDHLENRLERGVRAVRLDHREVVVEFEERVAVHEPDMVGDLDRLKVRVAPFRCTARRGRAHRRRGAQIVDRRVDDVAIDVELALDDVAKVDRRGKAGRKLNAFSGT